MNIPAFAPSAFFYCLFFLCLWHMPLFFKKHLLLILLLAAILPAAAQLPKGLSVSGYADVYVAHYSDSLPAGTFQKFPTYAPRSNSIGLNIAQVSAAYKDEKVRALITLHYGDIPTAAWSNTYNLVQEANVGVRLHKKLWLDAGFFRTHIGVEGLFPKENIASSIALVTLCDPYYEAGFKLTYQITPKLEGRLYILNGYNTFVDNNRKKSLGMLFTYNLTDSCSLVYANYLGDDSPDTARTAHNRFYNNVCLYYEKRKLRITIGVDAAVQQHSGLETPSSAGFAIGGLVATRYSLGKETNIYARAEGMYDRDGFLLGLYPTGLGGYQPVKATAGTLGIEYKPMPNAYLRLEARALKLYNVVAPFYHDGTYHSNRLETIFSMGVWF